MLFLIGKLNFTEAKSYVLFGTFNAFLFAFIWLGGWIDDNILGAKRIIIVGVLFLIVFYASLSVADTSTIYY